MISYIEIYKRIDKKQKRDSESNKQSAIPINQTKYEVPLFNESFCSKTKKQWTSWKMKLRKILSFVLRHNHIEDKCVIMPISTIDLDNLALWKKHQCVSYAINDMIEIGILRIESYSYRYGFADTRECRTYRYYKENAEKYIQFCKSRYIFPYDVGLYHNDDEEIEELADFDTTRVVFCSDLKLIKPKNVSELDFKEFLEKCLYENYPQLDYYKKLSIEINNTYYQDEFYKDLRIKFIPHFQWSKSRKSITKIGIRATCSLDNRSKKERPMLRERYGLDKEKDIKSSVPRVTLSLNNGSWYLDNVDLYAEIYKNCEQTDEFTVEMREAIKALFMRAYFDNSEDNLVHHTWIAMEQEGVSKQDVGKQMKKLRAAIFKTCGNKPNGSEIFLAESCVYLRVFQRLLQDRRNGWLLYDAFYCSGLDGESDEKFNETVEQYIKESFNEYLTICNNKNALLFSQKNLCK